MKQLLAELAKLSASGKFTISCGSWYSDISAEDKLADVIYLWVWQGIL
jgi:hypothetical protein